MSEIQDRYPVGTRIRTRMPFGLSNPGTTGVVAGHEPAGPYIRVELSTGQVVVLSDVGSIEPEPVQLPEPVPVGPSLRQEERTRMDLHFEERMSGLIRRIEQDVRNGPIVAMAATFRQALQREIHARPPLQTPGPELEINWDAVTNNARAAAAPLLTPPPPPDEPMRRTYRCRVSTDNLISPTITTPDDVVARGGLPAVDDSVLWLVDRRESRQQSRVRANGYTVNEIREVSIWYVRNRETEIAGPFETQAQAEQWCRALCTPVHRTEGWTPNDRT